MKEKKNLIIILILLVGVVGITLAYFSNSTSIDNLFSTKKYGSTITEEFISPDGWLPGDETSKSIVATNTGEVDQAVRISYTEKWLDSNNNELNGWIHEDGTKSSHTTEEELSSDERVAIINFDNNDDWTYKDGYYYYNYRLQPNESTSSLIKSVTFNPKTKLDDTCTSSISNGKKTVTCNSSGSDYDNAIYTLTFTIETVQFNKYGSAWGVDVALAEERQLYCDAYEVGEVVTYNNQDYYVLKDSSTEDDYVTLLKKDPLTAEEINQYSTTYVSQDGEYPYFESDACNENDESGCSTNYDTSNIKKIVDGWSSSLDDDLVSVDGYKARLLNEYNILNDLKFDKRFVGYYAYYTTSSTPKGIFNNNYEYWTSINNYSIRIIGISNKNSNHIEGTKVYKKAYIRPVINLKKSVIQGNCIVNNNEYLSCDLGDEVTYNNEKYYVMEDSSSNMKIVTLLKKDVLTADEINEYSTNYESVDGEYPYYESDTCNMNNESGCSTNYDISNVKSIIDNWSNSFNNHLSNIDGYKARLVNENDIINKLSYESYHASPYDSYRASLDTPEWAYISGKEYWSMQVSKDSSSQIYGVSNVLSSKNIYNKLYIRPVINLKKSAIESGCHIGNNTKYTTYSIGETISYNNSNYCVISNSSNKSDYVILIKQEPLTYDELVTYNNGYELGRDNVDNNSGIVSYYKSATCYYNSKNDNNTIGCSNDYNNSFIKNIVNNWSNSFNSDLKEINGYKTRLITNDELIGMGHRYTLYASSAPSFTKSDYDCLYSDADYWTMSSSSDSTYKSNIVSKIDNNNGPQYIDKKYAVRPVINLKKCALTNTCE